MTFSIVIPTYNGEDFVAMAIESALAQTRPADEIIVSDDNSSDRTVEICQRYAGMIRVCRHDGPSGFVNGWNKAIAYATCDFISILHQDDLLRPTFLEEAERALSQHPECRHLFAQCDYIDANNEIISAPPKHDPYIVVYKGRQYIDAYNNKDGEVNIHRCPGVITHRSIFQQCRYREEAGHLADNDFFFRVGQFTDVVGVLKPLAAYRNHGKSETGHIGDKVLARRLLHDYSFQLAHFGENSLFTYDHKRYFKYWRDKYFRRLIGYAIRQCDPAALLDAFRLRFFASY